MNFFASWEAPPIKKPSIFSINFNSLIFLEFTDPPYKTFKFLYLFFIKVIILINSLDFGIKPVPIDHTGS